MTDAPKEGAAPAATGAAARFQVGPSIDKILAIPQNLDGLTPLQAADCFLKSEEFYVERALRVASEMETRLRFHVKLNKTVLTDREIAPLFLNLQQIYSFNRKLYLELLRLRLHGDIVAGVGQCMLTHIPFFKLYAGYIKEYRKAQAFIDVLLEKKKKFVDWLDLNELCAGYSLKQLLLAPVTRMPQYLIMLGAIVRSLDPASPSAQKLLAAVAAVSKVTDEIAQALKDEVSRKLVVTLQARIFGNNCNLISPHRFVVKHSDLKKMYNNSLFGGSSKVYLFILFNDCLIYGTRPGRLMSGSIKHVLPLVGMSLEDERDDEAKKVKNGWKIHSATKSFVVCAPNGPTKGNWMQVLKEQVALANASASTLQKSAQAADAFERHIKNKNQAAQEEAQRQTQAQGSNGAAGGGVSTAQQRTTVPIQSPHSSTAAAADSYSQSHSQSHSSPQAPPPAPASSYGGPPPPAPSGYGASAGGPPPPPGGPPAPPSSSYGNSPAPPRPPPPTFGGGAASAAGPPPPPRPAPPAAPHGYGHSGGGGGGADHADSYNSHSHEADGDEDTSYVPAETSYVDEYRAPEAPVLQYDVPVVGSAAPPPPPMSAPAAPAAAAPKTDLLSQIQAGKALRSANAQPDWVQILDPASGAYYYEHKVTGESVWEAPALFVPAAAGSVPSGGVGGQAMEDKLKNTLDRYRQFVQDEEDDVGDGVNDDEWD